MKNIKNTIFVISLLLSTSLYSKDIIKGSWRHTDSICHINISKKIIVLTLNTDGTYIEYITIIPKNRNTYVGLKHYVISGKWTISKKNICFSEYGITKNIPLDEFYSNFENIQDLSSL